MRYIKLGRSGLDVSPIAIGAMTYGEPGRGHPVWSLDEEASRPLIKHSLEAGINFFDTANLYSLGSSEEILGRALRDYANRDDVVITTKIRHTMRPGPNGKGLSRKAIMTEIDHSLRRLGTDYVDIYMIHRLDNGSGRGSRASRMRRCSCGPPRTGRTRTPAGTAGMSTGGTVVRPHPAATRWSLASQSRAVWAISGRSSRPGHTPIRRSSPELGLAIQRWPRRSVTSTASPRASGCVAGTARRRLRSVSVSRCSAGVSLSGGRNGGTEPRRARSSVPARSARTRTGVLPSRLTTVKPGHYGELVRNGEILPWSPLG
jgi:hypothetical protein